MRGARAIGLLVTLGLVIAGCGSTPNDTTDAADEAETRIRRSEPSLVTEAAVDPAGTVWILGQRDGNLVLSAHPLGETGATSTDLGPTARYGSIGIVLVADDRSGVVVGTVRCASGEGDPEVCGDAQLTTEHFTLDDDRITTAPWTDPAPVSEPTAVSVAGRGPGALAFRSGEVIVTTDGAVPAGPEPSSRVCVQDGNFVAVESVGDDEPATPEMPETGDSVVARLHHYEGGDWRVIEGSETSFAWHAEQVQDFRCGPDGVEIAEEGQPARSFWDGTSWHETGAEPVSWLTYDAPPEMTVIPEVDRLGIVGLNADGNLVRIDSMSGEVLAEVEPPVEIDHWWNQPGDGVRLGVLALGEVDGSIVAASCPVRGATLQKCDIWTELHRP